MKMGTPKLQRSTWATWAVSIGTAATAFTAHQEARQGGRQDRGGPPAVFHSVVPDDGLSVIQSDPSFSATTLSLMAPKDLTVTLVAPGRLEATAIALKANAPRSVRLSGLDDGLSHAFEARFDGGIVKGRVRAPRRPGTEYRFAVQADSHLDQNTSPAVYTQTLRNIAKDSPDFLIDLGDTFMTEKHARYEDAVAQYRAQRYYLGLVGQTCPVFFVLGNHDGEQGWVERNKDGMTEWSANQRKLYFPQPQPGAFFRGDTGSANYFEFTWGDAQVIVLDPFLPTKEKPARTGDNWLWTLGKEQYQWLSRTLQTSRARHRFVFIHHLVGGSGKDSRGGEEASRLYEWGGQNTDGTSRFAEKRPGWEAPVHDLLRKHHVSVVFHGHDHLYAKQERDGLVYQLVPQPSHAREGSARSAAEYGYRSGKILDGSGYIRVTVKPDVARIEFVRTSLFGETAVVADSYELKS